MDCELPFNLQMRILANSDSTSFKIERSRLNARPGGVGLRRPFFTSRWLAVLALALTLFADGTLQAADPGSEALVVYNTRVPESKAIAEHYASVRHVPADQVIGLSLTRDEDIKRTEFRDDFQKPLAKMIAQKELWRIGSTIVQMATNHQTRVEWKPLESRIRYLVLCYGVPLRIPDDPDFKERGSENVAEPMRRNGAAVDNELALLPLLDEHLPAFGPIGNREFRATNSWRLHPTNGILMVARLDGPNPDIAMHLVDKAVEAETNGLWGRAYFDLRNTPDPNYKIGDEWIRTASEVCRRLGFETIVDTNYGTFPASFPMSQIALYMGWYAQDVCGPFAQPTVEFMPGAFAYHLHSYSASSLRNTNRSWAGPLLLKGATITMGCVAEPYLPGTPDVAIFADRFVRGGFSFGEAAYACQAVLSWQTTVVGDPLYRPFAWDPDQLHKELTQRHSKYLQWSFLRLVNLNMAMGRSAGDAISLLESLPITKQSAILSEKVGDLYNKQGKPSSCVQAWSQALKLEPTPQQRVRITLELGAKLATLAREPEAYEDYQALLDKVPDYPERIALLKRLLPLAEKLKKTSDAQQYRAEIDRLSPAASK
jgi:uncharacterized protein (TIGR03790 family)